MSLAVALRAPEPHRDVKLLVSQTGCYLGAVHAPEEVHIATVALLSVVGDIDDDGVFLLETLHYLLHYRVVVEQGVVVVGHHLPLFLCESLALIVVKGEVLLCLRHSRGVVDMLTLQVKYDEIVVSICLFQAVVLQSDAVVVVVEFLVARIEHRLAQRFVVQEEPAAEVIYGLLGLRQKLVGDEGDVIACLAEQLREQRIVAPLVLVANGIHREHHLEYITGEVPRCHSILHLYQFAPLLTFQLARRGGLLISVELRVVAVVTLPNDKHDVGRGVTATINHCILYAMHESRHLFRREAVGINAKGEAIDGQIEVGACLLRKFVFHVADVVVRHQSPLCLLVCPAFREAIDEEYGDQKRQQRVQHGRQTTRARH